MKKIIILLLALIISVPAFAQWKDITPDLETITGICSVENNIYISSMEGIYSYFNGKLNIYDDTFAKGIGEYNDTIFYYNDNLLFIKKGQNLILKLNFLEDKINSFTFLKRKLFVQIEDYTLIVPIDSMKNQVNAPNFKKVAANDSLYYALTIDGKLMYSSDGFKWENHSATFLKNKVISNLELTPKGALLIVIDSAGIYRSLNEGKNWNIEYPYIDEIYSLSTTGGFTFAGIEGAIAYTKSGYSWYHLPLPEATMKAYNFAATDSNKLAALVSKRDKDYFPKVLLYDEVFTEVPDENLKSKIQFRQYNTYIEIINPENLSLVYAIYDIGGGLMLNGSGSGAVLRIDLNSLSQGNYFIKAESKGISSTFKFIR